jgi:hypothetical protein
LSILILDISEFDLQAMETMLPILTDNSDETLPRTTWRMVPPRDETKNAAIRFIQSQIGGPGAALEPERSQALEQVDF